MLSSHINEHAMSSAVIVWPRRCSQPVCVSAGPRPHGRVSSTNLPAAAVGLTRACDGKVLGLLVFQSVAHRAVMGT